MNIDLGPQPESRTLDEWAGVLCDLAPGTIHEQWNAALVRACQRGTCGFFSTSTAPRTPRIAAKEIRDWIRYHLEEGDLTIPLGEPPRLKAPRSFRSPADPAQGHHATRATIGRRCR